MSSSMEPRPLTSAMESPTFEEDSSFHVEQPVGSMSISPCGRDVVLASKEGLHVIDLDSPYSPPRYLPHHTPWEVADVQWSPFAARDQWVVSTSNQKALVWNLAMKTWQNSIEIVLHAHTRAITDINFSAFHPDILATCSVDSFVHCWDLRAPSRPAVSFSDWFTGATQVKWNRQDPHVIASSHDRFLRIWDDRMGAYPIKSIEAHSTKIYGVDWNRVRRGGLVTCSLDRTIKFWDYTTDSDSDVPEKQIHTPFPVWRARNTPFGWGMLAMPQRGNNDLHLYSRRAGEDSNPEDDLPLVHTFPGHKGQVKEFLWRPRGGVADGIDHREYQLVTWGADRELRLHKVNPEILARVGYEKGRSFISTRTVTRLGAVYRSFRDVNSDLDIDDVDVTSSAGQQNQNTAAGTGMNAITVPHARGWIKGGHHVDRFGMQPRSNLRADTNPIAWMRGVKISGWDIETLGDEISQVGEKFTKVAFDSVDVRQRKISISLNGPWGADGASLFLKVDIKFPTSYPKTAIPTFAFQKTAAVTDEWAAKTTAELRTIAETYMSRNRGCLEGAVRYLLGESSLEDSIAWILGETGDNLKSPINGELEGESSDEDEVGMTQSQELGMSSELLRPVNANVMVPVAKVCGALWANDGRLICFFPPKPKKDKSAELFENMGFKEMTRWSRGDKVFQGFGRLHTNSPGPRGTGTITSTDDGDSDDSDESYSDTSSSSGSSDVISGLPTRFPAPRTWRSAGSYGLHRPRSTDNSQRSTAGGATVKSEAPQNIVSIHNLSDMLPVKRELASQYRICGKGTDVCAHNAAVALDAGCYELAQIWGLIKLILHARKSAGTLPESGLLQRRTHKKGGGSGGLGKGGVYRGLTGSIIRWGDHPLGSHWLVPALFEHFERIGDIQMVAMLSCVLLEANQEGYLENQQAKKTPGKQDFSLDFSPVPSAIPTKPPAATPGSSVLKEVQAAPETSARSSSETWRLDSTPPYSTGTTPPVMSRPRGIAADRKNPSHSVSMAASPDQQSQVRSGSGFGSVLASSLSRSFTFGPSSASPPTSRMDKKKPTPQNSPSVATGQASQAQSETESNHTPEPTPPPARFKVTFKNQSAFESDGPAQDSFLDTDEELLYRSYRIAYANLLSIWDLPVQQSEVMKIGAVADRVDDLTSSHYWNSTISKETDLKDPQPEPTSQALDFQRHCASCGHALQLSIFNKQPIAPNTPSKRHQRKPSGRRCPNCKPRQPLPTKLPCVICGEVVDGMLIPCLSCGHVSCFDCHRHWFLRPADKFDSPFDHPDQKSFLPTCPTGCGCQCSEHIAVDVPMPVLEPVSHGPKDYASVTPHSIVKAKHSHRRQSEPVGLGTTRKEAQAPQPKGVGQSEHDLDAWHDSSPFASLARGLGGGLSRGLQTKEARKKNKSVAVASNLRNS
ncbi:Zinc finger RING-type [Penicillium cf. griseofulvum]|uniref:Zinc finger RING-type n=1 Tax=Penicillium cf. griseofulvum TaxID=2972120 RepID=A0A9W9JCJ7_9EURO|nr:Zinc finger RING-type [Penicillium cf. griseofulvum]KAJ5445691.1 Zinc finger RING-type [Penicillium cf. griseofulvum]